MFPIRWNKAFRKKDGSLTTIGAEIDSGGGGGQYELPTASSNTKGGVKIGNRLTMSGEVLSADAQIPLYTPSDSGKVLTVNSSGELEWDTSGSGGGDVYDNITLPVIEPYSGQYYDIAVIVKPLITSGGGPTYKFSNTHDYELDDIILLDKYDITEFFNYVTDNLIDGLDLDELFVSLSEQVSTVILNNPITDYKALVVQGVYNSSGASSYDTTIIYSNPQLNVDYWFGMKDRNNSYSGILTFTDTTHAQITSNGSSPVSRLIKIYGIAMG